MDTPPQPDPAQQAPAGPAPEPQSAAPAQPQADPAPQPQPDAAPQPAAQSEWQAAQQEQFADNQQIAPAPVGSVAWKGAEYVEHDRPPMWYGIFFGATIATALIIYVITEELLAAIVIIVVGGSIAFFAGRPPIERSYEIATDHIKVNNRRFGLDNFKSFSVVAEGQRDSIWLKPTKRFAPFLILYFNPEDEDRIINSLASLFPHEERELDNIDRLTRKLKF